VGLVPWKLIQCRLVTRSATATSNTTIALALLVSPGVFLRRLEPQRLPYFGYYVEPRQIMLAVKIVEDFTKTSFLSFRLFGKHFLRRNWWWPFLPSGS